MVNTAELRARIQSEMQSHLDIVAKLQEKLALVDQVEKLSDDLNSTNGDRPERPMTKPVIEKATPEPAPAETPNVVLTPPIKDSSIQPINEEPVTIGDTVLKSNNHYYAYLHQGLQAYVAGKPDKALELLLQAREVNLNQFEKSWTTMTSIPLYERVAQDKILTQNLFG